MGVLESRLVDLNEKWLELNHGSSSKLFRLIVLVRDFSVDINRKRVLYKHLTQ